MKNKIDSKKTYGCLASLSFSKQAPSYFYLNYKGLNNYCKVVGEI